MVNTIYPPITIGILGGGQLGRMMAISAKEMGYKVAVLDPIPNSPTGQIADFEIVAEYDDIESAKQLVDVSDVITYEFENVDVDVCRFIESSGKLPQGSHLIDITQDRAKEKEAIVKSGAKTVPYAVISNKDDLIETSKNLGFPVVVKTRQGGYDGKGQVIVNSEEDIDKALPLINEKPCIVEKFIDFQKEISIIVHRSTTGELFSFPVSENIHIDHILIQSIVPARIDEGIAKEAKKIAEQLATSINMIGTLGVEMFLTAEGEIFINEVAPRPHNSGHYTIDGCTHSQFDQHIRAICGLPLGEGILHHKVVMMNILGEHLDDVLTKLPQFHQAKLHLYGKEEVKTGRKMGHINFVNNQVDETMQQIKATEIWRDLP